MMKNMAALLKQAAENQAKATQKPGDRIPVEKIQEMIKAGRKIEAIALVRNTIGCSLAEAKSYVEKVETFMTTNPAASHNTQTHTRRHTTQIDDIVNRYKKEEDKGGGSVWEWLKSKFQKR